MMRRLRVAICHPDLGIGGAERLIVDAAVEIKNHGHNVHVFTAHHDRKHCFEETRDGSFPVTVYGDFLPRNIYNRLHAVFAYIRCVYVALCMLLFWPAFDVILVDQVSAVIPILKLKRKTRIVFYCHFPDLLLAEHSTALRRLYRKPLDYIEELTTGMADQVLVNSSFTASTFAKTFKTLHGRGVQPTVLYPAVNVHEFSSLPETTTLAGLSEKTNIILSINRFEKKKNVELAVSAFALVLKQLEGSQEFEDLKLVVAGGYDERLTENREVLQRLRSLAETLGVAEHVIFLPSCSTHLRNELLGSCTCVVYTPSGEHFGIVPLEAMAAGKPVIACNDGGPKESVVHLKTGLLCEARAPEFASALAELLRNRSETELMGKAARAHVQNMFSREAFGNKLADIIEML